MSENGEIYTAGKNFTLPPALTGWTNSTSAGKGGEQGDQEHEDHQGEHDVGGGKGHDEHMGGAQLLWPEQHDGDHDQVGEQAHNNWGEGPLGLDWIRFSIEYWCGVRTKCQPDKMPTGHNANQRMAFCPAFFQWLAFCPSQLFGWHFVRTISTCFGILSNRPLQK